MVQSCKCDLCFCNKGMVGQKKITSLQTNFLVGVRLLFVQNCRILVHKLCYTHGKHDLIFLYGSINYVYLKI
jgi:hypothetical protein